MREIKPGITFDEFVIMRQQDFPDSNGELSRVLRDIALAAKVVNREVNKAGLVDILGAAGQTNVQGESQQKLDVYANDTIIKYLSVGGEVCGIGSEENDDFISVDLPQAVNAKYVVLMDPLDGSSNIDVNVSIGTIFSVFQRVSPLNTPCTIDDFLQEGNKQVAAGYVIYGSSTMMVYTTGNGVNGFTLDPSIGEFCLSHINIKTPEMGKIYSVNHGGYHDMPRAVKDYIDFCSSVDKEMGTPYSLRYIGSMVADLHRNLIKGGVFLYPPTAKAPKGKLRLLYECNPMAFIVEQAGGTASTGEKRVMDIKPTELHQRIPIIIGSKKMVADVINRMNVPIN